MATVPGDVSNIAGEPGSQSPRPPSHPEAVLARAAAPTGEHWLPLGLLPGSLVRIARELRAWSCRCFSTGRPRSRPLASPTVSHPSTLTSPGQGPVGASGSRGIFPSRRRPRSSLQAFLWISPPVPLRGWGSAATVPTGAPSIGGG